jgi:precorrin-6B methylase 2
MSLLQIVEGAWLAEAMSVVIRLGIPDLLRNGPRSADELAALTSTHAPSLHRVLRALAGEGVFERTDATRFALTESTGALLPWAQLMLGDVHQGAWGNLMHGVQSGESAFQHTYGVDLWEYCAREPAHARLFAAAMAGFTSTYIRGVLSSYSFAGFRTIVDVGGGDGCLLVEILQLNPASRGVVFERPEVVAQAAQRIREAELGDRCAFQAGDALVEVPRGGDIYVLSRVLHDWDDAQARAILANCAAAVAAGGRVLVIERVMPDSAEELAAMPPSVVSDIHLTDLNMMVMTTGRERSVRDYERLFTEAGLRLAAVVPTATSMSVLELRA